MKKLYQVLNQLGYPAGYELFNPHALFKTKKECKEYISYLKSDCGSILLHEIEDETIECLCGHDMDLSDCPDLWHKGC